MQPLIAACLQRHVQLSVHIVPFSTALLHHASHLPPLPSTACFPCSTCPVCTSWVLALCPCCLEAPHESSPSRYSVPTSRGPTCGLCSHEMACGERRRGCCAGGREGILRREVEQQGGTGRACRAGWVTFCPGMLSKQADWARLACPASCSGSRHHQLPTFSLLPLPSPPGRPHAPRVPPRSRSLYPLSPSHLCHSAFPSLQGRPLGRVPARLLLPPAAAPAHRPAGGRLHPAHRPGRCSGQPAAPGGVAKRAGGRGGAAGQPGCGG